MSDVFKVSQSKVKTWRRCRAAYNYKYVLKLRKKSKSRPLMFGTLVHQMIEADANGDNPFDLLDQINLDKAKLFAVEKEQYGEIIEDVRSIMTEYFEYWEENSDMRYLRMKSKSAEHHFEIELMPGVIWNGKIDALGTTGTGRQKMRWLVEHKSFKRKPNEDARWRNLQSATYIRAVDILGWKAVDGVCWDYIWSKPPLTPGLLQSGAMSQKSIDTLPHTVRRAIKNYGFKAKDYSKLLEAVKRNRTKWFDRIHRPVGQTPREIIFSDFEKSIREMVDLHGKVDDMNIEQHCSWCDYEPLCRARLEGLDYDFVKERNYEESPTVDEDNDSIHSVSYEEI